MKNLLHRKPDGVHHNEIRIKVLEALIEHGLSIGPPHLIRLQKKPYNFQRLILKRNINDRVCHQIVFKGFFEEDFKGLPECKPPEKVPSTGPEVEGGNFNRP